MSSPPFVTGVCDYCPKPVIWGNTGKARMPVDPQPVAGGNVVLIEKAIGAPHIVVTGDAAAYPGRPRYVSHFDSCPGADQARTKRPKPPPPQAETLF